MDLEDQFLEQKKYLFNQGISRLTNPEKKEINNNYRKINMIVRAPNNFPNLIKGFLKEKNLTQLQFFIKYRDKYPTDSAILHTYASYFSKAKRPSLIRMHQILEYINTLNYVPKKEIDELKNDIEHKFDLDQYTYLATIFSSYKDVLQYFNRIIDDAFKCFNLYLTNLQIILNRDILSWSQLKTWINVDHYLKNEGKSKIELIKAFSFVDMKILDYQAFNISKGRFTMYLDIGTILEQLLFSKKDKTTIETNLQTKQLGITSNNLLQIYDSIYPNFQLKTSLIETWPRLKDFFQEIKNEDLSLYDIKSNSINTIFMRQLFNLNSLFEEEYYNHLYETTNFPQFNEQMFIYDTIMDEINSIISLYLSKAQPKYYHYFN